MRGGDLCDVADDLELGDGDLLPCTRARRGEKGERASKLARTKDSVSLFTAVYLHTQMRKKDRIALKQEAP